MQYKLYCSFGVCLSLGQGPQGDDKLSLLNTVWKVVTKITDPAQYMAVAEVFIDYPLTHCSVGFFFVFRFLFLSLKSVRLRRVK